MSVSSFRKIVEALRVELFTLSISARREASGYITDESVYKIMNSDAFQGSFVTSHTVHDACCHEIFKEEEMNRNGLRRES